MTTAYLAAEGLEPQLREELQRAGVAVTGRAWPPAIADGRAIGRVGREHLARLRRVAGRLDRRRRQGIARHPAQLGDVCAAASPPRGADPGAAAACLGQAARVSGAARRPRRSARGPCSRRTGCWRRRIARALSQRRGRIRRGQDRSAEPRLSEALGGSGRCSATLAAAGRSLPRSRASARAAGPGCWRTSARASSASTRRRSTRRWRAMPGVEWRGESAFALDPRRVGPVDWLFSDIVCYPARLLRLVERWRAAGTWRRTSSARSSSRARPTMTRRRRFAAIPGAQVAPPASTTSTS